MLQFMAKTFCHLILPGKDNRLPIFIPRFHRNLLGTQDPDKAVGEAEAALDALLGSAALDDPRVDQLPLLAAEMCIRDRFSTPATAISSTRAPSASFAFGTMQPEIPASLAAPTIESTPGTGRTPPSRPSSPITARRRRHCSGKCP